MADEQKKSASQSAVEAAGSLKDAAKLAKDVGRVFAGDMSAIKDILANKLFQQIILYTSIIIALVGMVIGSSITGVLHFLGQSWERNWSENDMDMAIASNGDLTAYKIGWLIVLDNTVKDVFADAAGAITNLFSTVTNEGIQNADGKDNSNLTDQEAIAAGKNPTADDYENTMQAILTDKPNEGIGLTPALQERIQMIRGRVKQRGIQIKNAVYEQYVGGRKSKYNKLAKTLTKEMEAAMEANKKNVVVLYAGFNDELAMENYKFDTSAFELSELQALKILAIFSIQHDCQLTEMDMWSLMDYCGWFSGEMGTLDDVPDSIYDCVFQDQRYGNDIGTVTEKNLGVPVAAFEMDPLKVPLWKGSCAAQWYYEQQALIREHNRQYLVYWEDDNIPEGMIPWGVYQPPKDANTYTIPAQYALADFHTYDAWVKCTTYVDYSFEIVEVGSGSTTYINEYTPDQPITVKDLAFGKRFLLYRCVYTWREFDNGNTTSRELIERTYLKDFVIEDAYNEENVDNGLNISMFDELSEYKPFGIIDKLYYSAENNLTILRNDYSSTDDWSKEDILALGDDIYEFWEEYIWAREDVKENYIVRRNDEGKHSVTFTGTVPSSTTKYTRDANGIITKKTVTSYSIGLYNAGFIGIGDKLIESRSSGGDYTFRNLAGDTQYRLKIRYSKTVTKYTYTYDEEGNITGSTPGRAQNGGNGIHKSFSTFTTFPDRLETQAYQLYSIVNLTFKARSVDEIAFDLLGIWPGNLNDTVQVVRTTKENNLVGVNSDGQYSYCLREANMKSLAGLVLDDFTNVDNWLHQAVLNVLGDFPLMRSRTISRTEEVPMETTRWKIEYCLNEGHALPSANNDPNFDDWRTVEADNAHLVFDIDGNKTYFVYCRITQTIETLYADGTYSSTEEKFLIHIDTISPYDRTGINGEYIRDTKVEDGTLYADGHLGNELMRLNWQDVYTDFEGTQHTLDFSRMAANQYETYVDMVMALCELLNVPYGDWDPAVQRAKELGWNITD